ncbi:MAG TPA: hypothetical protein VIR54_29100, partial [Vicinamibacterales bacterium]
FRIDSEWLVVRFGEDGRVVDRALFGTDAPAGYAVPDKRAADRARYRGVFVAALQVSLSVSQTCGELT